MTRHCFIFGKHLDLNCKTSREDSSCYVTWWLVFLPLAPWRPPLWCSLGSPDDVGSYAQTPWAYGLLPSGTELCVDGGFISALSWFSHGQAPRPRTPPAAFLEDSPSAPTQDLRIYPGKLSVSAACPNWVHQHQLAKRWGASPWTTSPALDKWVLGFCFSTKQNPSLLAGKAAGFPLTATTRSPTPAAEAALSSVQGWVEALAGSWQPSQVSHSSQHSSGFSWLSSSQSIVCL